MPRLRLASARRWAEALFQLALEKDALEAWQRDLEELQAGLGNRDLVARLEDPNASPEAKREAVERALPGVGPQARNLLALLAVKGRLHLLPLIALEFRRLADAHQGVVAVEVYTAVPLGRGEQERVQAFLEGALGQRVRASFGVDPALLGGLALRIGDRVVDGSVRGRLEQMRRALAQAA